MPETVDAAPLASPLWRNRDYLLFWVGQSISTGGTEVSRLAYPLLILALTHSPIQAGIASSLRALAYLILGLPAGAFVDRWNRKWTMILCDIGRGCALGSLALAGVFTHLTLWHMYVVAFLEGALTVFFTLAEAAALPHVVAPSQLPKATAQQEMTDGAETIIGPIVGGAMFAVARVLPFLVDALSYSVSALSLTWMRTRFQAEREVQPANILREIGVGLLWIWRHPLMRTLLLLHSGLVFAVGGLQLIILVVAEQQGASSTAIGGMIGLSGLGVVAGAWLGGKAHERWDVRQILRSAFWLYAAIWLLFLVIHGIILLGIALAGFWIADEIYRVAFISFRLAIIPDVLRGRVTSALLLIVNGCLALSVTITGVALQRWGNTGALLIGEGILIFLALLAGGNHRLREA